MEKKSITIAKRRALQEIRAKRAWERFVIRQRPTRKSGKTYLIVCEWKNTEPSYFNHFKLPTITLRAVGTWYNTLQVVNRAKEIKSESFWMKKYDEIWCVFDADPKPSNPSQIMNFNSAIMLAEKQKFFVAYSHQAFEYWLLLHMDDHQWGKMDRSDYNSKINSKLTKHGIAYDWNWSKKIEEDFFNFLLSTEPVTWKSRAKLAVERARKIYSKLCTANPSRSNPGAEESSTTVFILVDKLLNDIGVK